MQMPSSHASMSENWLANPPPPDCMLEASRLNCRRTSNSPLRYPNVEDELIERGGPTIQPVAARPRCSPLSLPCLSYQCSIYRDAYINPESLFQGLFPDSETRGPHLQSALTSSS